MSVWVPVSDKDGPFWHHARESSEAALQGLMDDVNGGRVMLSPFSTVRAIEYSKSKVAHTIRAWNTRQEKGK